MATDTKDYLQQAHRRLCQDPQALASHERRRLVRAIAEMVLGPDAAGNAILANLLDLLARDPDWTVRLEVARMVHLLDDEAGRRYAGFLHRDCNSYVRSHAQRSLTRQRQARHRGQSRHSGGQGYAAQIDQLQRQYGKEVAQLVQSLADQRYALLANAVAHDVRSILTTLSANAAALPDEPGQAARVRSLQDDIRLLQRTIEAMEQFTQPLTVERHPEDLRNMIQQAVAKARAALVQQGYNPTPVAITLEPMPALRLRVSRRLIVLALTNLIQNAWESFAQREIDDLRAGQITIATVVDGYETRIIIRDNGPGIEPEVRRELLSFLPLGPNKAKRNSSGWGLSLVQRYVAAHGGTVTIDSQVDEGATVAIVLPMRQEEEP